MSVNISQEQWERIDEELFAGNRLFAIQQIRTAAQCSLGVAIESVYQRFDKLAAECPERFRCDLNTYWAGFYS